MSWKEGWTKGWTGRIFQIQWDIFPLWQRKDTSSFIFIFGSQLFSSFLHLPCLESNNPRRLSNPTLCNTLIVSFRLRMYTSTIVLLARTTVAREKLLTLTGFQKLILNKQASSPTFFFDTHHRWRTGPRRWKIPKHHSIFDFDILIQAHNTQPQRTKRLAWPSDSRTRKEV